jgi:hypothetical protein
MFNLLPSVMAALLIALPPALSYSQSVDFQVNVVAPVATGSVQVMQGGSYGIDGGCYTSMGVTLATPIHAGSAIIGVFKTEDGFACGAPNGSPDTVMLGSQQGTLLPRIRSSDVPGLGNCCANQVPFILFNATGASSTLTITNHGGAQFDGMGIVTEVAGFGPGASVDQVIGTYYFNVPTGTDAVTSGTITPSQAGDFLYGFLMSQYGNRTSEHTGTGWTQGANNLNIGADPLCVTYPCTKHPALDELILNYNSTSPVAATFTVTNPNGEYAPGIIAIKP